MLLYYYYILCMYMGIVSYIMCVQCLWRPEEDIRSQDWSYRWL